MKQIFQEVQPGIVFESTYGSLNDEPQLYMKMRDQKAINLATFSLARFSEQHIEVEIIGTLLDVVELRKSQSSLIGQVLRFKATKVEFKAIGDTRCVRVEQMARGGSQWVPVSEVEPVSGERINDPILTLTPDWENRWTQEEAERELQHFTFKGTGWYLSKCGEAMLVGESPEYPMKPDETPGKHYRFCYWTVSPMDTFNWIVNAPVRHDDR